MSRCKKVLTAFPRGILLGRQLTLLLYLVKIGIHSSEIRTCSSVIDNHRLQIDLAVPSIRFHTKDAFACAGIAPPPTSREQTTQHLKRQKDEKSFFLFSTVLYAFLQWKGQEHDGFFFFREERQPLRKNKLGGGVGGSAYWYLFCFVDVSPEPSDIVEVKFVHLVLVAARVPVEWRRRQAHQRVLYLRHKEG